MSNFLEKLEKLRLTLLKWNVAPLSVVVFLCWCVYTLIDFYKTVACTIDPAGVGALFAFIGGAVGLLYKMYENMQRNRGSCDDDKDQ